MVKLFLVCLAVCMGATSGQINLGTCTGRVGYLALSDIFGKFTLCFMPEDVYDELIKYESKITGVSMERKGDSGDLVINGKTTTIIKYTDKTTYLHFEDFSIAKPTEGKAYFKRCGKYLISEMCSDSGIQGKAVITVWTAYNGRCDTLNTWEVLECALQLKVRKWSAIVYK